MANIEVEIRSFISKDKYEQLIDFFNTNGQLLKDDTQETFYFSGEQDLRIQRNNFYAKVWLKKGKLHDAQREEIEIHVERNDFEMLEQLFLTLGYTIELEKMCTSEEQEREYEVLLQKLNDLGVVLTPKEEFDVKFKYYKENWKRLVEI